MIQWSISFVERARNEWTLNKERGKNKERWMERGSIRRENSEKRERWKEGGRVRRKRDRMEKRTERGVKGEKEREQEKRDWWEAFSGFMGVAGTLSVQQGRGSIWLMVGSEGREAELVIKAPKRQDGRDTVPSIYMHKSVHQWPRWLYWSVKKSSDEKWRIADRKEK